MHCQQGHNLYLILIAIYVHWYCKSVVVGFFWGEGQGDQGLSHLPEGLSVCVGGECQSIFIILGFKVNHIIVSK